MLLSSRRYIRQWVSCETGIQLRTVFASEQLTFIPNRTKMKSAIVFCVIALAAFASALPSDTYTDRYDNIDLDEILGNKRLLTPYVNCLLEKGKCTPEGKELKSHVQEALENFCEKCTEAQRNGTRKVIAHLINNEEAFWNELRAKYDPESKYVTRYESELRQAKA